MARKINSRLKIEGILTAQTPIHVGGYGESFETDMALAKNGSDEFYIPGTSLTGTLRSWFENNFPKEADSIWGYQKIDEGHASFVLIEDLRLPEDLRDSLQSELRDGVGIDRHYGTAADKAKYDRAILPKGTELKFEMTVEIGENHEADKTKAMFGHLLEALQNGEIRLGASKTRGLGKVKLTQLEEIREQEFNKILDWLRPNLTVQKFIDEATIKTEIAKLNPSAVIKNDSEYLQINIDWKPKSPLMVKASYDGIGVDTLPLVSANGKGNVSLVLPGSSVKGAFRAQAERILRTLLDIEAPSKFDDSQNFSKQIRLVDKKDKVTEKATKLIGEIFGAKKEKEDKNKPKSTLGLGALSIDDCFAEKQMNAETWQAVEVGKFDNDKTYSDTKLHEALRKVDSAKSTLSDEEKKAQTNDFHISHHTAIDRFTGAASDGALFSVLKPSPTMVWENLNLSLDLRRFSTEASKLGSLMLLLLILRDFAQNRLPLGFAVNRGMGEVKDVRFEITGAYNISYQNGNFNFTDDEKITDGNEKLKTKIQKEWKEWITKNQTSNS